MTTGAHGGIPPLADLELELLRDAFPAWEIVRSGSGLRADKGGFKSQFTTSPALMMVVLAHAEFTEQVSRVSTKNCRTITE